MNGSHRISVRITGEEWECVQRLCQETGYDASYFVRQALDNLLGSKNGLAAAGAPKKRLSAPESIMDLVPKYFAWGKGDLRNEQRGLFLEFLASSFACKKLYPRTKGTIESYESLLQLCEFFGVD